MRSCLYCEHFRWMRSTHDRFGEQLFCTGTMSINCMRLVTFTQHRIESFNEHDLRIAFKQAEYCQNFEQTESNNDD